MDVKHEESQQDGCKADDLKCLREIVANLAIIKETPTDEIIQEIEEILRRNDDILAGNPHVVLIWDEMLFHVIDPTHSFYIHLTHAGENSNSKTAQYELNANLNKVRYRDQYHCIVLVLCEYVSNQAR